MNTNLTQIHDNTFMYLLPQMGTEYLDKRDFQSRNFAMHKDSGQIQLHLETYINLSNKQIMNKKSKIN